MGLIGLFPFFGSGFPGEVRFWCGTPSLGSVLMSHVAVPVRLGSRRDRLGVWRLAGEQRQAFNRGVGLCLEAFDADVRLPSKFDLHKQLTVDRGSGRMPCDVPAHVQRPGVEAGCDAVVKWSKARRRLERNVAYWAVRLAAAELRADGNEEWADVALAAVCCRAKLKPTLAGEVRYCAGRLDKARQRRDRHEDQGSRRLFRSRKQFEREPRSAAAVVIHQGAQFRGDGTVRLPGGLVLRLADRSWKLPEGHEWTGAVQLVDTTRKVTSKTRPEHRRWALHVILKRADPDLVKTPGFRDEVVGVDAGVVNHVTVSDGRMINMADETEANDRIRELQQARSRCDYRSRRWRQLTYELNRLYQRRTDMRDNSSRQIAASVVKTPGVTVVGVEKTNTVAMTASAAGTKAHPGRRVAAKRGLNRSLSNARYGGIRRDIQRSASKHGVLCIEVPAQYTSQFCHECGNHVARESQSSYWCAHCGKVGHADLNAARNVKELTWRTVTGEPKQALRASASSEDRAGGKPAQPPPKRLPRSSQTKVPANGETHL